jgi:hypothetical protein
MTAPDPLFAQIQKSGKHEEHTVLLTCCDHECETTLPNGQLTRNVGSDNEASSLPPVGQTEYSARSHRCDKWAAMR